MHRLSAYKKIRTYALIYGLKKYVINISAIVPALILGFIMFYGSEIRAYQAAGTFDILGGLQSSMILSWTAYILPVLVCFPCVMRLSEELVDGYSVLSELRTGRKNYAIRRLGASLFSGSCVMLLGILIYTAFAVIYCICNSMTITCNGGGFFGDACNPGNNIYYHWIASGAGWAVYGMQSLFLVLYAMFWTIAGTVISIFVTNRRVAIVSPFLFKRFLEYAIPDSLFFLLPSNLRMSGWTVELAYGGIWYGILYILVAFLIGGVIIFAKLTVDAVR